MTDLCPYCGTRNPGRDQCGQCGGLLDELSLTATQIALGPWYFRLPKNPFNPGCNLAVLRRMVTARRIKPDTPVRGPATHQLWRKAATVPGLIEQESRCSHCGHEVAKDANFCPGCGRKVTGLATDRNHLGVDGEVADHVAEQRRIDEETCPRCGAEMAQPEVCDDCGALYDPPEQAVKFDLGAWFVRNNASAYFPGMSYAELKREVAAGRVHARTIVRGPTTEQFWQLAKDTPGVANVLGACHRCEKSVDDGESLNACPHCGASFNVPDDDNVLGLRYPTDDSAAAAQQALDRKLAALNEQQRAAGQGAPVMTDETGEYAVYEAPETIGPAGDPHAHANAAHSHADTDHDHANDYDAYDPHGNAGHAAHEYAEAHAFDASHSEHDVEHEAATTFAHDEAEADAVSHSDAADEGEAASAETTAPTDDVPIARPRSGKDKHDAGDKEKPDAVSAAESPKETPLSPAELREEAELAKQIRNSFIIVAICATVVLGGVVMLILNPPGGGKKDNGKDKAGQNEDADSNSFRGEPTDALTQLRNDADAKWQAVSTYQREGELGALVAAAEAQRDEADAMYRDGDFIGAESAYRRFLASLDEVQRVGEGRQLALYARQRAAAARESAKEVQAEEYAKNLFETGVSAAAAAQRTFDADDYAAATKQWEQAVHQFGDARQFVASRNQAADARARLDALTVERYTREKLNEVSRDAWPQIQTLIQRGDAYRESGQYAKAVDFYSQARDLLPQLDRQMKRAAGRPFYAYHAGRLVAQVAMRKANDPAAHPDDDTIADLRQAFTDLQLDPAFADAIPADPSTLSVKLSDVLITQAADAILQAHPGEPGLKARAAFNAGIHFVLIEKLLRVSPAKILPADRSNIRDYLRKLKQDARTAGFSADLLAALDAFEQSLTSLGPDETPTAPRALWTQLTQELDSYDSAMKLMKG